MNNPTTQAHTSAPFNVSRDKWLSAKQKRDNSDKRINSKLTVIKSRHKRLQTVQRTIQGDIQRLQAEIIQLEQYIPLLNEEMEEHQQAMFASLGGVS